MTKYFMVKRLEFKRHLSYNFFFFFIEKQNL